MANLQTTKKYFLSAVSSAINGTYCPEIPEDVDFSAVYRLSVRNSAQSLLYEAVKDKEITDGESVLRLKKACQAAVMRDMRQQSELQKIKKEFHNAKIDFMLLKGAHLKPLYPAPELRFMVDMDILVKKSDVSRAREIILSHGLTQKMNNGKDIVLVKEPFLTIELHNTLFVEDYYMYGYFLSVWDKAEAVANGEYKMSYNDLYVYTMAHLAEHYTSAGSCFRPVIDIYLLNKKCSEQLDFGYINEQFSLLGLTDFAQNIKRLGECWFGGAEAENDETLELVENYILLGPPVKNVSVAANVENESRAKSQMIFESAFPKLKHMKLLYPILEKAPFLLPLFWLIRIFKILFNKQSRKKIKEIQDADSKDIAIMKEIYKKSGL